jgi:hypothetical protein
MAKINLNKMSFDEVGGFQKFNKTKKKERLDEVPVNKKKKRS